MILVDLVAEGEGAAPPSPSPVGDGERVSYELEHWGNQLKVSLEGMLDVAGIRRLWEVGALVVSGDDAEAVEALIATVEGRDVDGLQEVEEQLAFEIEGLDAEDVAELDARLIAAGIVHAWSDEGDLLVALDDEDEVTAIIDAVVEGEVADEGDGLAANQALSEVYVAVDRLVKSPSDRKLIQRLEAAAAGLEPLGVPYGFAAKEWADLKHQVAEVVATADEDPADPDQIDEMDEPLTGEGRRVALASDLRERLLTWV